MNFKQICSFYIIFPVICEQTLKPDSKSFETLSISKVIREIIEEFYVKNNIQFDVTIIGNSNDVHSEILKEQNPYRLSSYNSDLSVKFGVLVSTVYFIDSCFDYVTIHFTIIPVNQFPHNLKFLIYIHKCGLNYIKQNLKNLIKQQKLSFAQVSIEIFEFILINDRNFLHLATIEWFTEAACNQPQLKVLNSFNKITQKWNKTLENYEKFQDFHGCELIMGLRNSYDGTCWEVLKPAVEEDENPEVLGLKPDLFRILGRKHNFKPSVAILERKVVNVNVYFSLQRVTSLASSLSMHMTSTFLEVREVIVAKVVDVNFERQRR